MTLHKFKQMKTIITIEGNIGAGKSTLISMLKERHGDKMAFVEEQVDAWTESGILELFYSDPVKYAFKFQCIVIETMMKALEDEIKNGDKEIIICDRCPITALKVFSSNLLDDYILTQRQFDHLQKMLRGFNHPMAHVYLRTSPKTCHKRMKMRNRDAETNVTIEYLERLHTKHEQWIGGNSLILDGEVNFIGDEQIFNDYVNQILHLTQ